MAKKLSAKAKRIQDNKYRREAKKALRALARELKKEGGPFLGTVRATSKDIGVIEALAICRSLEKGIKITRM